MSSYSETLSFRSDTKSPVLYRGEYHVWKGRFMDFIENNEQYGEEMKKSILEGNGVFRIDQEANPNHNPPLDEIHREKLQSVHS